MKFQYCIIFTLLLVWSCSNPTYRHPHVLIETGMGDIELELYPDKAPVTVAAFLSYIDEGLYDGTSFYRVLKSDDMGGPVNPGIIQAGIFHNPEKAKKPGLVHETTARSGLSHTDGTVSMARTEPGTASTEFFICIGDQSPLDSGRRGSPDGLGFAAFGTVFKGMKTVKKIQEQRSTGDAFDKKIRIQKIRRL